MLELVYHLRQPLELIQSPTKTLLQAGQSPRVTTLGETRGTALSWPWRAQESRSAHLAYVSLLAYAFTGQYPLLPMLFVGPPARSSDIMYTADPKRIQRRQHAEGVQTAEDLPRQPTERVGSVFSEL